MTDLEFVRAFTVGLGAGFLLGVVAAGYAALGFRERRGGAGPSRPPRWADNTVRRLFGAGRNKRRLT